ncbi:transposase [Cylindrospermum sp. FACHB-282]|nr:transposase [Cylindrospermum sp. FACHB-282]MBD2386200.1 transposase [Cylindrospermum sp. FACHB-282]
MQFYTDSDGNTVPNPKHLRKSEKTLKCWQCQLSRQHKSANNCLKSKHQVRRNHLKVSRQRKYLAVKVARCLVQSNDLVAYVGASPCRRLDLLVRNMVSQHLSIIDVVCLYS